MRKPRLHPLDKPYFMESVNQKWAAIYTVLGIGVLIASAYGFIHDPAPFLGYFTGIGVTFILGASGSDIMKAYKVDSLNSTSSNVTDQNITTENHIVMHLDPKDVDGPAE